jgi:hypothetical protein
LNYQGFSGLVSPIREWKNRKAAPFGAASLKEKPKVKL